VEPEPLSAAAPLALARGVLAALVVAGAEAALDVAGAVGAGWLVLVGMAMDRVGDRPLIGPLPLVPHAARPPAISIAAQQSRLFMRRRMAISLSWRQLAGLTPHGGLPCHPQRYSCRRIQVRATHPQIGGR